MININIYDSQKQSVVTPAAKGTWRVVKTVSKQKLNPAPQKKQPTAVKKAFKGRGISVRNAGSFLRNTIRTMPAFTAGRALVKNVKLPRIRYRKLFR